MSASAGLWRVAAWLPAVLVVPAAMAGAVYVSRPDDKLAELRDLVPIDVGTTWVYDVFADGEPSGTRTRQVTGQAAVSVDILDAVTVSSVYTDFPGTGPYSDLLYLGLKGNSLDQLGVFVNHEHLAIDPPAPAYELPLTAGHAWSYEGTVGTAKLRYDAELEAIEDVEVGGRTFTDCLHFVNELSWRYDGQKQFGPVERSEEWTCPGFGPVRSSNVDATTGVLVTEELVEFHGASGNWYAEAPDEAQAEEIAGGTVGLDVQRTNAVEGELDDQLAWTDGRSSRFDFPPVADDEVMVLVERDGEVSAMDVTTGEMRWRVRLAKPIVATPTLAGDRVLVADAKRNLWALSLSDGTAKWVRQFDDMVTDSPAVSGGTLVVPTDDRRVTALDLTDGSTSWTVQHGTSVRTAPAVDGDHVVVADRGGEVTAYDVTEGTVRWSRSLEGGTLAGPTVADGRVIVGDDEGIIYAISAETGDLDWQERTIFYPSEGFAAGNGTVLSIGDGLRVEAYDLDDGDERWSFDIDASTSATIVGDHAVTVDDTAHVVVRDLADGHQVQAWDLPMPTADATASVDSPVGLVGDTLVFNANVTAEGHNSILYAYPVSGAGVRRGVSFDSETRVMPETANGGSVLHGKVLFTPAIDQALYRSEPGSTASKVFKSDGLLPGVALAGDLVISQNGQEVLALPVDGGDPVWRYTSTDASIGAVPAANEDTVFVPQYGVGLAAVSLADGQERWATTVDLALGSTAPLPLPDGDVVYGGGAVSRFDGETGKLRWSILDGVLFGNAAYADGLVFGDVYRSLSPSGLTALDAETGETVWLHENVNTQIGIGPVVGEGVVVHTDSLGLITAFDAPTGEELWHLQLSTTAAGQPVIMDGRVYLGETGRKEDLFQREYRLSAHDLRTGAFLGSYQPPGSAYWITPSVGGNDGAVFVPGYGARGAVMMILRPRS